MPSKLPATAREQIRELLFTGRKIEAIKLYRASMPGVGLKEAKDGVAAFEAELRKDSPDKFSRAPSRIGCTPMFLALVVIAVIFLAVWLGRK